MNKKILKIHEPNFILYIKHRALKKLTSGLSLTSVALALLLLKQILKSWFQKSNHSPVFPPEQNNQGDVRKRSSQAHPRSELHSAQAPFLCPSTASSALEKVTASVSVRRRAFTLSREQLWDRKQQFFTRDDRRWYPATSLSFLLQVSELVVQIGDSKNCERWCDNVKKHTFQNTLLQWVASVCGHWNLPFWAFVGLLAFNSSINAWSSLFFSLRLFLRTDTNQNIALQ